MLVAHAGVRVREKDCVKKFAWLWSLTHTLRRHLVGVLLASFLGGPLDVVGIVPVSVLRQDALSLSHFVGFGVHKEI